LLLIGAVVLALVVSNSPLAAAYTSLLDLRVTFFFGKLGLDKPLLLWINDGLMAIFFLLIGLELKCEVPRANSPAGNRLYYRLSERSAVRRSRTC
jgi:NhaA family Na+:H+ antiporter